MYYSKCSNSTLTVLLLGLNTHSFLNNGSRLKSYEKLKENGGISHAEYMSEMTPLTELPSTDDLTSNDVESWLETSSKYHSCEIVDMD